MNAEKKPAEAWKVWVAILAVCLGVYVFAVAITPKELLGVLSEWLSVALLYTAYFLARLMLNQVSPFEVFLLTFGIIMGAVLLFWLIMLIDNLLVWMKQTLLPLLQRK